jgi:hypothetical protein
MSDFEIWETFRDQIEELYLERKITKPQLDKFWKIFQQQMDRLA